MCPVRGKKSLVSADVPEAHRTSNGMWKNTLLIGLLLGILGAVPLHPVFAQFKSGTQLFEEQQQRELNQQFQTNFGETPEQRFQREQQETLQQVQPQVERIERAESQQQGSTGGNSVTIQNPIGASDFYQLVNNIARAVTGIALVLATLAIVIVGFKFVMASVSGDASKLTETKKLLMWVLIGTAIVVAAAQLAGGIIGFVKGL